MADNTETLRDVLSGFNSMQMRLGLTPGAGSAAGFTPMQMPQVKHPGEASAAAVAQLQQITATPPIGAGSMGFMPQPGAAAGQFSAQFQQRMQTIQSGHLNPFVAQQMSQQGGGQGFSMLPDPTFMTNPSMGVFRPGFTPPPPMPIARAQPFMQTPFTPQFPAPMFQTPRQMRLQEESLEDSQMFAGAMSAVPTAARIGTGIAAAGAGMLTGAHLMGRFGPRAAGFGRLGGLVGGAALGFGALGRGAESLGEMAMEPAISRRVFGEQMQGMSRNFVVGGADMDESGRGLSLNASLKVTNQLRKDTSRGATSGFNMRDMMSITSQASDMGMMDMAQSGEQIIAQARNIAKGLSNFMKLANEPDIKKAMQQMGQMRQMGLSLPETTAAMQRAQSYARMAGTTVDDLGTTAGLPGAMTFQSLGMSAGLGYQVGMGAGGMARQAVAGGAFSSQQLAMAGGVRGVQQTLTEAAGAGLGVDFPLMAMLKAGKNGNLALDESMVKRISRGEISLSDQAGMGSQKIQELGGTKALGALSTQLNELRDQLGRTLEKSGGATTFVLRQALNLQKELGGSESVTLGAALRGLGLNEQQARTIELTAKSPQFWRNTMSQMNVDAAEAREQERNTREKAQEYGSMTARIGRSINAADNWLSTPFRAAGRWGAGVYDDISETFTSRQSRGRASDRGEGYMGRSMAFGSAAAQRAVSQVGVGDIGRFATDHKLSTSGALGSSGWDVAVSAAGILGSAATLGGLNALGGSPTSIGQTNAVAAQRAVGNTHTFEAGSFFDTIHSGLTNIMAWNDDWIQTRDQHARGASRAGKALHASRRATKTELIQADETLQQIREARMRNRGAKTDLARTDTTTSTVLKVIDLAKEKSKTYFGKDAESITESEVMRIYREELKGKGYTPEEIAAMTTGQEGDAYLRSIMQSVDKMAPPEARGSLATTENATAYDGSVSATTYRAKRAELDKVVETTREGMGLAGVSDTTFKEFSEMAVGAGADKLEYMQAEALMMSDDPEERKRGLQAKDALTARLGKGAAEFFSENKGSFSGLTDDMKKAVTQMARSKKSTEKGGLANNAKQAINTLTQVAAVDQMGRGIAAIQASGIKGVEDMQMTEEGAGAAMDKIRGDKNQMNQLRKSNPTLYDAVVSKDRKKFLETVYKTGEEVGETIGGKGGGGEAELAGEEQKGWLSKLADEVMGGGAQGEFAEAVPTFAEASKNLLDAAKMLQGGGDNGVFPGAGS